MKDKLQVEVSTRLTRSPDAIIIDGCALLWSVHWPVNGTVDDHAVNFMGIIGYHLRAGDVYLIFDRYLRGSTKHVTRSNRAGKVASRKHQLNLHTPLSAQKVILNLSYIKSQLIKLICQYLMDDEVSDTN